MREYATTESQNQQLHAKAMDIFDRFVAENSSQELNIDSHLRSVARSNIEAKSWKRAFEQVKRVIHWQIKEDVLPRFFRSTLWVSFVQKQSTIQQFSSASKQEMDSRLKLTPQDFEARDIGEKLFAVGDYMYQDHSNWKLIYGANRSSCFVTSDYSHYTVENFPFPLIVSKKWSYFDYPLVQVYYTLFRNNYHNSLNKNHSSTTIFAHEIPSEDNTTGYSQIRTHSNLKFAPIFKLRENVNVTTMNYNPEKRVLTIVSKSFPETQVFAKGAARCKGLIFFFIQEITPNKTKVTCIPMINLTGVLQKFGQSSISKVMKKMTKTENEKTEAVIQKNIKEQFKGLMEDASLVALVTSLKVNMDRQKIPKEERPQFDYEAIAENYQLLKNKFKTNG